MLLDKNLLLRNLNFLSGIYPNFVRYLSSEIKNIDNVKVYPSDGDYVITVGGTVFRDVKKRILKRMEEDDFWGIIYPPINVNANVNLAKILEFMKEKGVDVSKRKFLKSTDTLIILGAFPFFHIERILKEKKELFPYLKYLTIVEPVPLFWLLLLSLVDFTALLESKGFFLNLVYRKEQLSSLLKLVESNPFCVYAKSYDSDDIKKSEDLLKEIYKLSKIVIPERNVISAVRHTNQNLKKRENSFFLPGKMDRVERKETVCLVGSGPSLDRNIENLIRIRNRVIVVALGSAVRPLVLNGIIPDFTTAIDSMEKMDKVLLKGVTDRELKKITLITSPEVSPSFINRFGSRKHRNFFGFSFYALSSLFGGDYESLLFGSPTILNFSFEVFYRLGFRNFLLVGVDLGTKYDRLHSEFYSGLSAEKDRELVEMKSPRIVDGNFGGKVKSPSDFYASKLVLEKQIELFKKQSESLIVTNASDGAKIEGTIPCYLDEFEVEDVPDFKRLKKEIMFSFKPLKELGISIKPSAKEEFLYFRAVLNEVLKEIEKYNGTGDTGYLKAAFDRLSEFNLLSRHFYGFLISNEAYHLLKTLYKYLILIELDGLKLEESEPAKELAESLRSHFGELLSVIGRTVNSFS